MISVSGRCPLLLWRLCSSVWYLPLRLHNPSSALHVSLVKVRKLLFLQHFFPVYEGEICGSHSGNCGGIQFYRMWRRPLWKIVIRVSEYTTASIFMLPTFLRHLLSPSSGYFTLKVEAAGSSRNTGNWLASRPCRFTPRERSPGTHWIGGWVDPQDRSGRRRE
jgi:hypothetical protein